MKLLVSRFSDKIVCEILDGRFGSQPVIHHRDEWEHKKQRMIGCRSRGNFKRWERREEKQESTQTKEENKTIEKTNGQKYTIKINLQQKIKEDK